MVPLCLNEASWINGRYLPSDPRSGLRGRAVCAAAALILQRHLADRLWDHYFFSTTRWPAPWRSAGPGAFVEETRLQLVHDGELVRFRPGTAGRPMRMLTDLDSRTTSPNTASTPLRQPSLQHDAPADPASAVAVLSVRPAWPLVSLLPIAAISWSGQVLSRSSSRVHSPGISTGAGVLPPQTALTGSAGHRTIPAAEAGTPTPSRLNPGDCCTSGGPGSYALRASRPASAPP